MDNFLLHASAVELDAQLRGARLHRLQQLGATDLALDFKLRDGRWLLLSTDPARLALYLTARDPRRLDTTGLPARTDTQFVELARKHLGGARLAQIEKLGYDRVVECSFVCVDRVERRLIVLLTGRAANALLVEGSRILAALRERPATVDGASDAAPAHYRAPAPPADRLDPFLCSAEDLERLRAAHDGNLAQAAERGLIGFAPLYARELVYRAQTQSPHAALQQLLNEIYEAAPAPVLYSAPALDELRRTPGRAEFSLTLAPIRLQHLQTQAITTFATVNEAADAYFTLLHERRAFLAQQQQLKTALATRLKKQRTLLANLQRELAGFARADQQQRFGELLLSNLHQATKQKNGQDDAFAVTDFYDEAQPILLIPAAAQATAQEAADHYFKLARKARHGQAAINARLPEIEHEIAQLETRLAQLAQITTRTELDAFAAQAGTPAQPARQRTPATNKQSKEEKIPGVRRYRSSDGYEILVGRTDRDNDHLTFRVAKASDLWLHAADYPGSHVVIRNPAGRNPQRKPLPQRTISEAAQLAAKFSSARANAKVAVHYCEKKFVTKQKGMAPGQVRLSSFKTILVEPAEAGTRE